MRNGKHSVFITFHRFISPFIGIKKSFFFKQSEKKRIEWSLFHSFHLWIDWLWLDSRVTDYQTWTAQEFENRSIDLKAIFEMEHDKPWSDVNSDLTLKHCTSSFKLRENHHKLINLCQMFVQIHNQFSSAASTCVCHLSWNFEWIEWSGRLKIDFALGSSAF